MMQEDLNDKFRDDQSPISIIQKSYQNKRNLSLNKPLRTKIITPKFLKKPRQLNTQRRKYFADIGGSHRYKVKNHVLF